MNILIEHLQTEGWSWIRRSKISITYKTQVLTNETWVKVLLYINILLIYLCCRECQSWEPLVLNDLNFSLIITVKITYRKRNLNLTPFCISVYFTVPICVHIMFIWRYKCFLPVYKLFLLNIQSNVSVEKFNSFQ